MEHYQPRNLVIPDLSAVRQGSRKRVVGLLSTLERHAGEHDYEVYKYSPEHMAFVFKQFGARTRREMAKSIQKWLSGLEINIQVPPKRKPWESEHHSMVKFKAIGLALTHIHSQE